jgi:hypothetical protein
MMLIESFALVMQFSNCLKLIIYWTECKINDEGIVLRDFLVNRVYGVRIIFLFVKIQKGIMIFIINYFLSSL